MTDKKTKALKLALEALNELIPDVHDWYGAKVHRANAAISTLREALAEQQAHEEIERAMSQVWQDVPGAVNFGVDPKPAQHRAWFTVDELNAWADKKLKENPQWVEQPAQQQDANDRFMTVVYRNVQEDDAKSFTEHPKAVWFGWCHAPYQRDEARYKLEKVSTSPPANKQWVGLTREDWAAIGCKTKNEMFVGLDVAAKLKEKNNG